METIKNVSISELHSFRNHPFKVETNTELCELMRSIEKEGVLVPLLVRTNPYGEGYEVISGHRRKEAALWAGETEVPVVIRELDDDQAVVAMVDSNLHRENLKPSEKAFAYRMKLEAMKHQGKKILADDITLAQVEPRSAKKNPGGLVSGAMRSNELLAKQAGESVTQIKRYIRLTNLIPKILDMVDDGKIAFTVAVELSYLKEEEQYELHAIMDLEQCTPSLSQACRLKVMKGEVYEQNLFTKKNELFKADGFLDEVKHLYTDLINVCAIKEEDKLYVFDRNGMYLATKKIGKNNPKAADIEADNMERVRWNQAVDRALISGVAEEDILDVKREKISKEVKRSIELYGNNPSFLVGIIRLAIKALELLISKVLLAAAKVAERVVDNVHEKIVEKVVSMPKDEPKLTAEVQEKVQLPKKPIEPLLLSKYQAITKLDVELKRRNEEIFAIEQERSNLEIELSECTGLFKKKQRKELQERISILDKKAEKMKAELSKVLRDAGYANAAEFFTELFAVREEKQKYEEACKEWQEECVRAEISINREAFCNEEIARKREKRHR